MSDPLKEIDEFGVLVVLWALGAGFLILFLHALGKSDIPAYVQKKVSDVLGGAGTPGEAEYVSPAENLNRTIEERFGWLIGNDSDKESDSSAPTVQYTGPEAGSGGIFQAISDFLSGGSVAKKQADGTDDPTVAPLAPATPAQAGAVEQAVDEYQAWAATVQNGTSEPVSNSITDWALKNRVF